MSPDLRVLYLSSPIGLGHARRDVGIAHEMRRLVPTVEIEWLAQDPVTRVLADHGETVHPASRHLRNESAHFADETDDHDLHVFGAFNRMADLMYHNFQVFDAVVDGQRYDLVVGDEAWEVDHFLHDDPATKRAPFVWLTDFVGQLPVPSRGRQDVDETSESNRDFIERQARHPHVRDRSLFIGDPDDIVDREFGPGLGAIRPWTEANYDFTGFVTGVRADARRSAEECRAELGVAADEVLCIAAVGGSGIGAALLRVVIAAHRIASDRIDGLHTVVVTGPRLDPGTLPDAAGVTKVAYVSGLHDHLAAADLAVVQGGLSTTMELTAARVPFLFVPLLNHFEQQFHVRHRLARYRAGTAVDYATATPESLADDMVTRLHTPVDYREVATDGAARAARLILDAL